MSNEKRPIHDHHIANLDRHAAKIMDKLKANEWKLLSTPELEPYELKEILQDQAELEKVLGWLSNIKNTLRPPQIVAPQQAANGMRIIHNQ